MSKWVRDWVSRMRANIDRVAMGAIALALLYSAAATSAPFAVVEVGSKGVKSHVFDLERAEKDKACQDNEEAYLKCVAPATIASFDVNAVEPAQLELTVQTVAAQVDQLVNERGFAADHVFLVASSGVATQGHFATLKPRIEEAVSPQLVLGSVTEAEEGCYGFEGIIGLLPASVQELRAKQALLVDIGSGNTKFGFRVGATGKCYGFGYGFGVKTSTAAAMAMAEASVPTDECAVDSEENDLRRIRAQVWGCREFRPGLRALLQDNQEALNRKRVYVIGGMAWAMSNFTTPETALKFPPIEFRHFAAFSQMVNTLAEPPCDFHPSKAKNKDIAERICNAFSKDQLVVGGVLLEELALALNLKNKTAAAGPDSGVFFFRDSQFAWPLGYLRHKLGYKQ